MMVKDMKVNGEMEIKKEKEFIIIKVAIDMIVNIKMIKEKEKEL